MGNGFLGLMGSADDGWGMRQWWVQRRFTNICDRKNEFFLSQILVNHKLNVSICHTSAEISSLSTHNWDKVSGKLSKCRENMAVRGLWQSILGVFPIPTGGMGIPLENGGFGEKQNPLIELRIRP